MDSLRITLAGVAVLIVAGIYLWGLFARRRAHVDAQRVGGNRQSWSAADETETELLAREFDRLSGLIAAERQGAGGGLAQRPLHQAPGTPPAAEPVPAPPVAVPEEAPPAVGAPPVPESEPEPEPLPEPVATVDASVPAAPESVPPTSEPAGASGPAPGADAPAAPGDEELFVVLYIVAAPGEVFTGPDIHWLADQAGLTFGDLGIFHYLEEADEDEEEPLPVFSLANMFEPGTFPADALDGFRTTGLVMFLRLPGPRAPLPAFECMVTTAQSLAESLGGEVSDERRSALTPQTIGHLRERVQDYLRRTHLAQAARR